MTPPPASLAEMTEAPTQTRGSRSFGEVHILTHGQLRDVLAINSAVEQKLEEMGKSHLIAHKTPEQLRGYIGSGHMVGTFEGRELVGYGYLGLTSAENPDAGVIGMREAGGIYNPQSTAVIQSVMVHPRFWHRGHGKHIVREQLTLAQRLGVETLVSMVCTDNPESMHNLLKLGLEATCAGIDPSDGSQVLYLQESLERVRQRHLGRTLEASPSRSRLRIDPHGKFAETLALLRAGYRGVATLGTTPMNLEMEEPLL